MPLPRMMMICPAAGGATTVWTGGAKNNDGASTGTCGTTAGAGKTATGGATFTVTGAVVVTTTGDGTNPVVTQGNSAGACGGRTITPPNAGATGCTGTTGATKTGAAGTMPNAAPGTIETGAATGAVGPSGTATAKPTREPPACAPPLHSPRRSSKAANRTDVALMFGPARDRSLTAILPHPPRARAPRGAPRACRPMRQDAR